MATTGRMAKGASTGMFDANNNEIFNGSYLEASDLSIWRINCYRQAVPEGDGKAMGLAEFLRKMAPAQLVTEEEAKNAKAAEAPLNVVEEPAKEVEVIDATVKTLEETRKALNDALAEMKLYDYRSVDAGALVEELRGRGWTVTCSKTVTVNL